MKIELIRAGVAAFVAFFATIGGNEAHHRMRRADQPAQCRCCKCEDCAGLDCRGPDRRRPPREEVQPE